MADEAYVLFIKLVMLVFLKKQDVYFAAFLFDRGLRGRVARDHCCEGKITKPLFVGVVRRFGLDVMSGELMCDAIR